MKIIVFLLVGFMAGYFFVQHNSSAECCIVSEIEHLKPWDWSIYEEEAQENIYATDSINDYDIIIIFNDGELYAGKDRVSLTKKEKMRVKKVYEKIEKYRRHK